jgi:hypothetical protein
MQRPTSKLRQVYVELRRALGGTVPAGELLRLASQLVDATRSRVMSEEDLTIRCHPSFDELPLDAAFADGGWRILARERRWGIEADYDDDVRLKTVNINLRKMRFAA